MSEGKEEKRERGVIGFGVDPQLDYGALKVDIDKLKNTLQEKGFTNLALKIETTELSITERNPALENLALENPITKSTLVMVEWDRSPSFFKKLSEENTVNKAAKNLFGTAHER